jgi:hypothetical protein
MPGTRNDPPVNVNIACVNHAAGASSRIGKPPGYELRVESSRFLVADVGRFSAGRQVSCAIPVRGVRTPPTVALTGAH